MDYVVIARKYRPQTFAEVVGQAAVARTLTNAIRKQRIAHGFLFTGPSGVGKTTMARILAKALCCQQGPTAEPCGTCPQCRPIADGTHPDVYEIDAATHTGIDNVRDLSERATYSPTLARFRVFIMDECHMLSTAAWNALLKVVEEPPAHVYFIFATTAVDKVPDTVLNRCQRFDFRPLEQPDIVQRLDDICHREGAVCEPALLQRIARSSHGGMRDAQTLLDQLIAIADGPIAAADLDLLLGAARGEDLDALAKLLLAGDTAGALERLDRLAVDGIAPSAVLEQLVDYYRHLLLIRTAGRDAGAARRIGPVDGVRAELAAQTEPDKLLRICQVLTASQQAIRQGVDAHLQLELSCVRIGQLGQVQDLEALLRRIERIEREGAAASPR